jgi:hypothetical protein
MTYEKFSADNAALLLIDHQVGTMGWVKSIPFEEMKRNALMLAQAVLRQYRVRPGLMDVRGRLVDGSRRWRPRTRPGCQRRLAVGGARGHAISGATAGGPKNRER